MNFYKIIYQLFFIVFTMFNNICFLKKRMQFIQKSEIEKNTYLINNHMRIIIIIKEFIKYITQFSHYTYTRKD